ncbi:YybH family protein [Tropicimonas aquimaris]|uniref:YybH family protein n=1 Tax=Tropicimonas aquimaris TaxID=914152 RepID=A0ABW3INQ7_9RHOB
MRQHRWTNCALAACSAVALGVGTALPAYADDAADKAAIRGLWQTYSAARVEADAATWLTLWDAEGIQMPPGSPARGFEVLQESVPKAFVPGAVTAMEIEPIDIEVAGDWAFARGVYSSTRMRDGQEVQLDGKFLTILKRQDDGAWKIYRDCFNSND